MKTYLIFCKERGHHEGVWFATNALNKLRAFDHVSPFAEEKGYRALRSGVKLSPLGFGELKGEKIWYGIKRLKI